MNKRVLAIAFSLLIGSTIGSMFPRQSIQGAVWKQDGSVHVYINWEMGSRAQPYKITRGKICSISDLGSEGRFGLPGMCGFIVTINGYNQLCCTPYHGDRRNPDVCGKTFKVNIQGEPSRGLVRR